MMDYIDHLDLTRHEFWAAFRSARELNPSGRLIALTTKAELSYVDFAFQPADTLLLGRETSGLPDDVHAACDARMKIPMTPGARSLNVAVAAAMVTGEALRQTTGFGGDRTSP